MVDRPNVLVFRADQHRRDFLGTAGLPVRTPAIDGLTEDGVRFSNAVSPAPLCAPSRGAIASGLEYDRCEVPDNHPYPDQGTYYRRLRDEAGYHVMGCGKFDLNKSTRRWGLDGTDNLDRWGFSAGCNNAGKWSALAAATARDGPVDPYTSFLADRGFLETHLDDLRRRREVGGYAHTDPTPLPDDAYCDNWLARTGLDLLAAAPDDRPWFLIVNFVGPHDPVDVTDRMYDRYRDPDVDFPPPVAVADADGGFSSAKHRAIRRNYAAMVENVDRWVGRYLERLVERDERDRTVVVYTSDHGDMLGDHGQWRKRAPYASSVGVPFVLDGPDVRARGDVAAPATTLDITATVLDYAGLDPTLPVVEGRPPDSRTLRPFLSGAADYPRETVVSGLGPWRLVRDDRYKLVTGYDLDRPAADQVRAFFEHGRSGEPPDPLLFDLDADPGERTNVATRHPAVLGRLRGALDRVTAAG
jgi:choline-sulfatase